MQFLNSLTADNRLVPLAAALGAFLVFAVLILTLVRLLFGNRLRMAGNRGRQQRLGVVDSYDMDRQRQLVLVRRDNTEHLIMIGGPNDILIESAIVRVEARDNRERPATRDVASEAAPRLPVPDTWTAPVEAPKSPPSLPIAARNEPATISSPLAPPVPPDATEPETTSFAAPTPIERATASEPVEEPSKTVEPPAPPPVRPPIFARLRGRGDAAPRTEGAAPPLAPPPPQAPPVEATPAPPPPMAEADFFETEIAKALTPSLRGNSLAEASAAPIQEGAPSVPRPVLPRPPLRPFPIRRDPPPTPAPASAGSATTPVRPVRPPPPPFFSRSTQRPAERVEPSVAAPPPLDDAPAAAPPAPPPSPNSIPEPSIAEAPTPAPVESPAPPLAPAGEPIDPFEEEMARLLGRPTPKDN